ncbi:MAG: arginine repressor [Acidobacteria bacterium]|nr:arginine repressor [Acidobacteriota bacterium]
MARWNKRQRQNLIRRIVSEGEVFSQEELRSELEKHSMDATQATLSRDISELGLVKSSSTGTYQLPENLTEHTGLPALLEHLRQLVREVDYSGNLVLVKTAPGDAQAAGERFDHLDFKEVAGTLAGDDTLLVVIRERHSAARFARKLEKMVGTKR